MTKKMFIVIAFLMTTLGGVKVYADDPGSPISIELNIHEKPILGPGTPKTPVQIPEVWQDGHLILLETGHADFVLNLIDEDGILVYTTVVPTATTQVVIPSSFTGDFELQLIQGNFCFYGYISL